MSCGGISMSRHCTRQEVFFFLTVVFVESLVGTTEEPKFPTLVTELKLSRLSEFNFKIPTLLGRFASPPWWTTLVGHLETSVLTMGSPSFSTP